MASTQEDNNHHEEEGKAAGGNSGGGGAAGTSAAGQQQDGGIDLRPGLRVVIHSLTSDQGRKINGKIARVMSKQPAAVKAKGRVCVKVAGSAAGKPISVHLSNLRTGDEACCRVCGKTGDDLQSCSKCRKKGLPRTYYCSPECQETDWKRHKKVHKEAKTAVWVPVTEAMRAKAEKELATEAKEGVAIYNAAFYGNRELCAALIDCGADPDGVLEVPMEDGCCAAMTPLVAACERGHEHVALLLINEGCDVNFADGDGGKTPLYRACQTRMVNTVKLLLDKRADVNKARTIGGCTPLYAASQQGHVEVVKVLLNMEGIDPNKATADGCTPLHMASEQNHVEVMKLLLNMDGIDPNKARTSDGSTPLFFASLYGHVEAVKLLLNKDGIDVNKAETTQGATPLLIASMKGHEDVVKLLKEHGAV
eukprot:g6113.t1